MFFSKLTSHKETFLKSFKEFRSGVPRAVKLMLILVGVLAASWFIWPSDKSQTKITNPFELGEYYFNSDNSPEGEYDLKLARKYYTEAIESGEPNPMTWYQLGRIDFLEGNFGAALYKFEKQIALYGDEVPSVYYMQGLTSGYKARKNGDAADWQKAEEGFLKYLEYQPESPWAHTDLSWLYFSQGKFAEMVPLLEDGLRFAPENPWLLNMYGLALMNTGRKDEAREQFLLASEFAKQLTVEDWGLTYPGNDPAVWPQGLAEFQSLINKNIELVSE